MYDCVVTINNTHWPAYRKPGATLVDLWMFDQTTAAPIRDWFFGQRSCAN